MDIYGIYTKLHVLLANKYIYENSNNTESHEYKSCLKDINTT